MRVPLDAYSAMQRYFYSPADALVRRRATGAASRAQAWPFSQALWATLDIAAIPQGGRRCPRRPARRGSARSPPTAVPSPAGRPSSRPVFGGSGRGLQRRQPLDRPGARRLEQRRAATQALVTTARRLFALVERQLGRETRAHPCPGGVFWTRRARTATATPSRPRTRRCSRSVSTSASAAPAVPGVGADRLRLDEALPRPVRAGSSATTSTCGGKVDAAHLELQPGRDDRRRRAALPGDRRAPLPRRRDAHRERRAARRSATRSPRASRRCSSRSSTATCSSSTAVVPGRDRPRRRMQAFADEAWTSGAQPEDRALPLRRPPADAARPGGDGAGVRRARR